MMVARVTICLIGSLALLLSFAHLSKQACSGGSSITIQAANVNAANCFPFASGGSSSEFGSWGPTFYFVYQNIPAFTVNPGDQLAFDMVCPNDFLQELTISMAAAFCNGCNYAGGNPYVTVCTSCSPPVSGDTIYGNYELVFTLQSSFSFPGGGLVLRFQASGNYLNDNISCEQCMEYGSQGDPNNYFVERFYGASATDTTTGTGDTGYIGNFQLNFCCSDAVHSPVLSGCGSTQTLPTDSNSCCRTQYFSAPSASDADTCSVLTGPYQTAGLGSGQCFPKGSNTITYQVHDSAYNIASCSWTYNVIDATNPTISCPGPITTNAAAGQCQAIVSFANPGTGDNCGVASLVQTGGFGSGSNFPVGTTTNTFKVTDTAGLFTSCSFTVTVTDNQNPSITCPAPITINAAAGQCQAIVSFSNPTTGDNCAVASLIQTGGLASGSNFPVGTTTNTFKVTDTAGLFTSCSFTVTVTDNQNPSITCPAPITTNAAAGQCQAVVSFSNPTTGDNCAVASLVQTGGIGSGSNFPVGTTTNTFKVTDTAGLFTTCSFTVTVIDNQNPTITCPSPITTNAAAGQCQTVVAFANPTTGDNCAVASLVQTGGLASGSNFPVGTTTNTFKVTDTAGLFATCSFTVTVIDNQNPTITCPSPITTNAAAGQCQAVVSFSNPTTGDNCAVASLVQTGGIASGSNFPVGTTTNTFKVTDTAGLIATCSFTVTVIDNQNPTITCPSSFSVGPSSCSGSVVYFESFDKGLATGWTHGPVSGLVDGWAITSTTGGSQPTTLPSFAFGTPNNGPELGTEYSYLQSPMFATSVANGAVILFTSRSFNQNPPNDLESVQVSLDGGSTWNTVIPSAHPYWTFNSGQAMQFSILLAAGSSSTRVRFVYNTVDNTGTFSATGWFIDDFLVVDRCVANPTFTITANDNCPGFTIAKTWGYNSGEAHPIGNTLDAFTVTDPSGRQTTCYFDVTVQGNVVIQPTLNAQLVMYSARTIHWRNFGLSPGNVNIYLRHPITKVKIMDIVLNYFSISGEYLYHPQRILPGAYEIVVQPSSGGSGVGVLVHITVPQA